MRDGNDDPQSREKMADEVGRQKMQGNVHERDFLINKLGARRPSSGVCMQISAKRTAKNI